MIYHQTSWGQEVIDTLAKRAVLEGWGDYEMREACTVSTPTAKYIKPVELARLKAEVNRLNNTRSR